MGACPDRQETLWLDIYGELNPGKRKAWEEHLGKCSDCRWEREKCLHLVQQVRKTMRPPDLSLEKASALGWATKRKLRGEGASSSRWRQIRRSRRRLIPAMVLAALVVVAVGWFSFKIIAPSPSRVEAPSSGELVVKGDLEVIKNLELLEEMDTLTKLVHIIDQREIL